MDWSREDWIYELQQVLAVIPEPDWEAYLDSRGVDADLRREVIARQRDAERRQLSSRPRFRVERWPARRSER
jgi:hypothetical protein